MADDGKRRFLELVISSVIGTAAGYLIAYYATGRKIDRDRYVDRAIGFLERMKSRYKMDDSDMKDI